MAILVTDDFNRADANPVGGNWTTVSGMHPFQVLSNQLQSVDIGVIAHAVYTGYAPPSDHYSKITIAATPSAGDNLAVGVRMTQSTGNGYFFSVSQAGTTQLYILTSDSASTIGSAGSNHTPATNDVIECRAVGTTISGWINGTQFCSVTDATYSTGTFDVAAFQATGVTIKYDTFEGGDFSSASSATTAWLKA